MGCKNSFVKQRPVAIQGDSRQSKELKNKVGGYRAVRGAAPEHLTAKMLLTPHGTEEIARARTTDRR